LYYDPRYEEIELILKGKPEVEMGEVKRPAEPPDWRELREKSAAFLGQSKNLRVAVIHCCSLLKLEGLPGFRDGLEVVRGLVEQFWPTLYPLLDAEENNDPTQRLNALRSLMAPRGSLGTWLNMLDYLYATPLFQPKGAPPLTFDDLQAARQRGGPEAGASKAPDIAALRSAVREGGATQAALHRKNLQDAIESVKAIDEFLAKTIGARNSISFADLEGVLKEMVDGLQAFLGDGTAGQPAGAAGTQPPAAGAGDSDGIVVSGSIRSREDVVRALDGLCEYYRQVEPGSPVPFLLRRAQRLATMDFVQAVQELNLATIDSLKPSMGSAVEAPPPAT